MDIDREFNIQGQLTIDLDTYEKIKRKITSLERRDRNMRKIVDEVLEGSKELASLLNHISSKTPNFDDLVGAFNSSADNCEIQKVDDKGAIKYKIKLNQPINERQRDDSKA